MSVPSMLPKSFLQDSFIANRYTRLNEALESGHLKQTHLVTSSVRPMDKWRSLKTLYSDSPEAQDSGVLYLGDGVRCHLEQNSNVGSFEEGFVFDDIINKNNSGVPKPDKHYDCPVQPPSFTIHTHPEDSEKYKTGRELFRRSLPDWMTLYFRIRKKNYEDYVWELFHEGRITKNDMYKPEVLPFWTECIRFKIKKHVNLGLCMRGLTARLGLGGSSSLKFCIDGFFGLEAYGDIFGNIGGGAVPWMEINPSSTAESLRLQDGDMVFVNTANEKMLELVEARKIFLSNHD